jgi:hypothetical protein
MTLAMSGLMAIVVTAAFAQPAAAGPWRDFGGGRLDVQAQRQQRGESQRQPQRDLRRGERPPERDKRGDSRLTEEERRRLHRDLDRANREIYKGHGR